MLTYSGNGQVSAWRKSAEFKAENQVDNSVHLIRAKGGGGDRKSAEFKAENQADNSIRLIRSTFGNGARRRRAQLKKAAEGVGGFSRIDKHATLAGCAI